jgi:hypothetical protein
MVVAFIGGWGLLIGRGSPWTGVRDRPNTRNFAAEPYLASIPALLMIGHHLSISALCKATKASGVC